MSRVAAIDCGTNSIRLLIADVSDGLPDAQGPLTDVVREMRVVRLGQGVDATGELAPEALERTFAATRDYARLIQEHGAERVRFAATSATRDASNRQVFVDGIRDLLGVRPEVISGDEEAALSFAGGPAASCRPRGGGRHPGGGPGRREYRIRTGRLQRRYRSALGGHWVRAVD